MVGKYIGLLGLLQVAQRGAGPRRHRQPRAGQARLDRLRGRSSAADRPTSLAGHRRDPGARRLRQARHRGQDRGRHLRARAARCRSSASASACRSACIEAARNLAGLEGAYSTEFGPARASGDRADDRVDAAATARAARRRRRSRRHHAAGRLSSSVLEPGSRVADIYGRPAITERHRHRYEVNINYRERLEGRRVYLLRHVTRRPPARDRRAAREHPWFIGVQFHPELKSRPFEPHPLFRSFVGAAIDQSRLV